MLELVLPSLVCFSNALSTQPRCHRLGDKDLWDTGRLWAAPASLSCPLLEASSIPHGGCPAALPQVLCLCCVPRVRASSPGQC